MSQQTFFSKCSKTKENHKDCINKRMIDKLSQAFGYKIFNYMASLLTDAKRALIVSISCVLSTLFTMLCEESFLGDGSKSVVQNSTSPPS